MIVNIPPGSHAAVAGEIDQAAQSIKAHGLASHVEILNLDSKYNVCSVAFKPGASEKQKNAVYACIHRHVSSYEDDDGTICSGLPQGSAPPHDDSEDTDDDGPCVACNGTLLDAEGDVCTECGGHS